MHLLTAGAIQSPGGHLKELSPVEEIMVRYVVKA